MVSPEVEFGQLFEKMYALCEANKWGDPFSYARSREIHIAGTLGHQISETLSGADGIDEEGECEYKSTVGKTINGTYNGISVQPTWDEQVTYLKTQKIAKYRNHYLVRYEGGRIVEGYRLDGDKVLELLLPKLEKKYPNIMTKKDPRLGASITQKEIYEFGTKII